jgi:hypothetical protein
LCIDRIPVDIANIVVIVLCWCTHPPPCPWPWTSMLLLQALFRCCVERIEVDIILRKLHHRSMLQ